MFNSAYYHRLWSDLFVRYSEDALRAVLRVLLLLILYAALRTLLIRLLDGVLTNLLGREKLLGLTEDRASRLKTLQGLCRSMVGYVLFFVFAVLVLEAMGVSIMPFIEAAGVIGIAIGFGSQKLIKDVISGFFLIIDNVYNIGDTVTIGTVSGQVQDMGMRMTRIQDQNGRLYILANGDIGTVTNLSRNPVEDFIEVNIAAAADLDKAMRVIGEAGAAMFHAEDHHMRAAPRVIGITAFSATSVTIRVAVVSDPKHLATEQMRTRAAVRTALVAAEIAIA